MMKAEYVDHMGSDLTVVNAARVSFDKHVDEFEPRDQKLINYLANHNHFTPFTHPQITVRETVPIFVARQRFKHTVGFTYNEVSRRYVSDDPEFFQPNDWRAAAENVKQGSANVCVDDPEIDDAVRQHQSISLSVYKALLEKGVCAEQARMVLPQSMYTSYYVTGSLSAWARAYILRVEKTAQKEIQDLAHDWAEIIQPLFPASWAALTEGK
jgi:thymidylate synthase (FAD)